MRRLMVYWHSRRRVWSVRGGKDDPVWHVRSLTLANVVFKVNEAGRQRTIREHVKCVHAYCCGDDLGSAEPDLIPQLEMVRVGYNPYERPFFAVKSSGKRVDNARWAFLLEDGTVWVTQDKDRNEQVRRGVWPRSEAKTG